jgi:GT2 family glycosyltransferase
MRTFVPSAMTFNLNMVTRRCLDTVGYMDDRFTGNFIDYLLRIRQAGGEAIIVDAGQIMHAARATSSVASTFKYDEDARRFFAKYPEIARQPGSVEFNLAHPRLCQNELYRVLLRMGYLAPGRLAFRIHQQFVRLEPLLASK